MRAWACILSVGGLLVIVAIVFYQVFGRYVLNASPTWTESLALVLVLYVTLIGAAVGVRDAGHIGMESLLVLAPDRIRNRIELVIHFAGHHLRCGDDLQRRRCWAARWRDLQDPEPRPVRGACGTSLW